MYENHACCNFSSVHVEKGGVVLFILELFSVLFGLLALFDAKMLRNLLNLVPQVVLTCLRRLDV